MRFSQSAHLQMCLSLETLTSILRTGLPIVVELIDLVNLLRWLTFQLESQTVIPTVMLFGFVFSSSDTSICSTVVVPPLGISNHVVALVSIDYP